MFKILKFNELDSTNNYAKQNFDTLEDWQTVCAESQTAGRGRFGREWLSPPTGNLYFSIALKNSISTKNAGNLGQAACIAVAETLETYDISPEIKWPNDILASGKKICGILCESATSHSGDSGYIIGIGLNVNMTNDELLLIGRPATSVLAEIGRKTDCMRLLEQILENMRPKIKKLETHGFVALLEDYKKYCRFLGNKILISIPDGTRKEFEALSINPDGTLRVASAKECLNLNSAEICSICPQRINANAIGCAWPLDRHRENRN